MEVPVDELLRPWLERLRDEIDGLELYDAHTHIGRNDPDGFKQTPRELIAGLEAADARGVVFPMHEPAGYTAANDEAIAAARESGRMVAFCRVDPAQDPVTEARRALDAGAVGIKLHPRAEGFTMSHPGVRGVVALAHERQVPVLIHAGRGIPALGEDTVRLSGEFTGAKLILAHAAISDLSWLWRVLPEHRNVYVDTAWMNPVDVCALFSLAPPGQILWASDAPYGRPLPAAVQGLRAALQCGLTSEQVRAVAGGQLTRILAGEEPLDLGPPPGPHALHPLAERVCSHLVGAIQRAFVRGDYTEPLALARLACDVGDDTPVAEACNGVLALLDLFERYLSPPEDGRPLPPAGRFLVMALYVARTPDVPLPAL
jgi:predicted TIM-barrel fold metal-dependent hydrolase